MFRRIETMIGDYMVCMKMSLEFAFVPSAILAGIIISLAYFITERFPLGSPMIRQTPSPIIMLITPIFLTTKGIIALPRAKVMFQWPMATASTKADRFPASITWHYRESGIISGYLLTMSSLEINSIAGSRTALSDMGFQTVGNELCSTDFAYQFSHSSILAQHSSFNKAPDYRPKKKARRTRA